MRKNVLQLLSIFCIIFWSSFGIANTKHCTTLFSKIVAETQSELDIAFRTIYERDDVYQCGECHGNVIRLFEAFKNQVPDIKPSEFKVLYITTKKWSDYRYRGTNLHVRQARGGYSRGLIGSFLGKKVSRLLGIQEKVTTFVGWTFHVVLEYQGRIYDLDNTNQAKPVNGKTYLNEFFMTTEIIEKSDNKLQGNKDDLIVFVVPGERYLLTNTNHTKSMVFHESIFSENTPLPLVTYLESISN